MHIESAACTHIGKRKTNQDAFIIESHTGLYAVADGMGGYQGGDLASRLVVEALSQTVQRHRHRESPLDCQQVLYLCAKVANQNIRKRQLGALEHMGSTLAAMLVCDDTAVISHVGDSRVYRLRGGELVRLTRDHSLYEEFRSVGTIDLPPEAEFKYGNVITRALGLEGAPDFSHSSLQQGDTFLICSDGLTGSVADDNLTKHLELPVFNAARSLVQAAIDAGATDNTTVVVLRCTGALIRKG